MRISASIGASTALAAILTHGMVFSAMNFDGPLPMATYQGFFQRIMFGTEWLWSYAHGWQPLSHIRDFGAFYAPTVQLGCPLLGFALFRTLSRHKVGMRFWRPPAIAVLLFLSTRFIDSVPDYALPWVEAARTVLVTLLMVWSVGAIRFPRPRTASTDSLATATPAL
jgi:hypothetical protein